MDVPFEWTAVPGRDKERYGMATAKTAPGPRGDWLLGSTLDFKASPLEFIVYVQRAYGDVARFRVGPSYWYLVSHPDDIHSIMTEKADIFLKPTVARRLWSKFLGDGILTSEGEVWRRQNRMMRPAFHRDRINAYGDLMVEYTHRMIDGWTPGETVDFDDAMVALTLAGVLPGLIQGQGVKCEHPLGRGAVARVAGHNGLVKGGDVAAREELAVLK